MLKMKSIHDIRIDKKMPYRIKDLAQCITDSLDVNIEIQQTQGFYELMGNAFKGFSNLDSIQHTGSKFQILIIRIFDLLKIEKVYPPRLFFCLQLGKIHLHGVKD